MACVLCGGCTAVPVAIHGYGAVPKPQDGHDFSVVYGLPFPEAFTVPEPYQPLMKSISSVATSAFWTRFPQPPGHYKWPFLLYLPQ